MSSDEETLPVDRYAQYDVSLQSSKLGRKSGRSPALHSKKSPALHSRKSPKGLNSPAMFGKSPGSRKMKVNAAELPDLDLGQSAVESKEAPPSPKPDTQVRVVISASFQGKPRKPVVLQRAENLRELQKVAKTKLRLSNKNSTRFFDLTSGVELKDLMTVSTDTLIIPCGSQGLDKISAKEFAAINAKKEAALKQEQEEREARQRAEIEQKKKEEEEKKKKEAEEKRNRKKKNKSKKGRRRQQQDAHDEEEQHEEEEEEVSNVSGSRSAARGGRANAEPVDDYGEEEEEDHRKGKHKGKHKRSKTPQSRHSGKTKLKGAAARKAQIEEERRMKGKAKKERKLQEQARKEQEKERRRRQNKGIEAKDDGGDDDEEEEVEVRFKNKPKKVWHEEDNLLPQRERLGEVWGGDKAEKRLKQKMRDKARQSAQTSVDLL